jgi:hypothetical protein
MSAYICNMSIPTNQILDGTPQLYHYTSPVGLAGMLEYRKLWFSQFAYSNDESEYSYAINLITSVLEEYGLGKEAIYNFPTEDKIPLVFTFSLSEKGDLLSQWRGYCPDGGYSISFDTQQLNAMMSQYGLVIGKCVYDEGLQKQLIRDHIIGYSSPADYEAAKKDYRVTSTKSWSYRELHRQSALNRIAPLIKHPGFKEEEEWKIIKSYEGGGIPHLKALLSMVAEAKDRIRFRGSNGMLIPYFEMELTTDTSPVNIRELIVGPTPHKKLSLLSADAIVAKFSPRGSNNVKSSITPYRKR